MILHSHMILCLLVLLLTQSWVTYCREEEKEAQRTFYRNTNNSTAASGFLGGKKLFQGRVDGNEHGLILDLALKMKPRPLLPNSTDATSPPRHRFLHLHHMKSGGTSLSTWIACGIKRQEVLVGMEIPRASLSECGYEYSSCVQDENDACRGSIERAVAMNYCSPLAVADYFNWTEADAVTMMRHPVDRVWSMFRFRTKHCYNCTNLTQVYEDIDNGDTEKYAGGVCLPQLSNHITRNLQKNIHVKDLDTIVLSDEERLADAIDSIQNRFTVVGVIEQLEETIKHFTYSFPWLSEQLKDSDDKCYFPHSNGSPLNNGCGEGGEHWPLPHKPDEETRRAIENHNRLDIKVYQAALDRFELQKTAMRLGDNLE